MQLAALALACLLLIAPSPATSGWSDLGHGTAGSNGVPQLAGFGHMAPGFMVELDLFSVLGSAPATLVVGFSAISAPFKGGVLVPSPDLVLPGFVTYPEGFLDLAGTWPLGVPSGFELVFQWWIADPLGPHGFAASNGVLAVAP